MQSKEESELEEQDQCRRSEDNKLIEQRNEGCQVEWTLEMGNLDPTTKTLVIFQYLSDKDAMQLGAALKENTSLEYLTLGVGINRMSGVGAQIVAEGIRQSHVQKLRLHHSAHLGIRTDIQHFLDIGPEQTIQELMLDVVGLGDEDLMQLATSLTHSKHLSKLDFILESGISELGAEALALGVANSRLTCFRLNLQTNISELREIMYQGIQQSQSLQRLEIVSEFDEWNSVADIGDLEGILSSRSALHDLSVNGKCCIESLAEGLRNRSSLMTLELRWQELDHADMQVLCAGMFDSRSALIKLDLGRNPIDDQGMATLVQCLESRNGPPIHELVLDHSSVGAVGTQLLLRAVTTTSLKYLDLSWNTNIGYKGLKLIGQEVPKLTLHKLKVTGCIDTDLMNSNEPDCVKGRRQAGCALLEGIKECAHLRMLDVQQNGIDDDLIREIEFYSNLNRHGRFLLEQDNDGLIPALWCRVLAMCKANANFIYFFLREQPNLVSAS